MLDEHKNWLTMNLMTGDARQLLRRTLLLRIDLKARITTA